MTRGLLQTVRASGVRPTSLPNAATYHCCSGKVAAVILVSPCLAFSKQSYHTAATIEQNVGNNRDIIVVGADHRLSRRQ